LKKSKDITSTRVCPSCGKAFIWFVETPLACPYCGYLHHEKRGENRTAASRKFVLRLGKKSCQADLLDYSRSGARVSCPERIAINTVVSIDIEELDIHRYARAVWTKSPLPGLAMAGFKFI
jgi:rubredoxin